MSLRLEPGEDEREPGFRTELLPAVPLRPFEAPPCPLPLLPRFPLRLDVFPLIVTSGTNTGIERRFTLIVLRIQNIKQPMHT